MQNLWISPQDERLFDVIAEGRTVIDGLDVMLSRDGKIKSALTVTVPGVEVTDGELNIRLQSEKSAPVLSAVVVSKKHSISTGWELAWSDEFNRVRHARPGALEC